MCFIYSFYFCSLLCVLSLCFSAAPSPLCASCCSFLCNFSVKQTSLGQEATSLRIDTQEGAHMRSCSCTHIITPTHTNTCETPFWATDKNPDPAERPEPARESFWERNRIKKVYFFLLWPLMANWIHMSSGGSVQPLGFKPINCFPHGHIHGVTGLSPSLNLFTSHGFACINLHLFTQLHFVRGQRFKGEFLKLLFTCFYCEHKLLMELSVSCWI